MNLLCKLIPVSNLGTNCIPHNIEMLDVFSSKNSVESVLAIPKKTINPNIPILQKPSRSFSSYIKGYSTLPINDRALVALRSAHLNKTYYLLPKLSVTALDHGLKPSDIRFISNGRFFPGWSLKEQLLINVVDDLYRKQEIDKPLWNRLLKIYSHEQILGIFLSSGAFHLCTH